jgi:FKBP-type peptidyl-prolyl cis-trans isomerase FklB
MQSEMEKVSYVIGHQIGGDLSKQGLDINLEILTDSIKTSFQGKDPKMSEEEMQEVMMAFQQKMQAQVQEQMGKVGEQNTEAGKAFLEANLKAEGWNATESGLQYKVVAEGSGDKPTAEQQVEVHYEGKLLDGTIFDSSVQRGETITFPVNGVIPGWQEALQLMTKGSKWQLAIPSDLAYGAQGAGQAIGPNAALLFEVELIDIK